MIKSDEILTEVKTILNSKWDTREGIKIPEVEDITLSSNEAVLLDATVLYADMRQSTNLVDTYDKEFAAKVYKTFLLSSSKIIQNLDGKITAFDGDRIMAIFIGDYKNSYATKTAMHIKYLVSKINEEIPKSFNTQYKLNFGVGIDTSNIFATRTGMWNYNDIVWLGKASNYAAKYSELGKNPNNIVISKNVYDRLRDNVKNSNGRNMWNFDVINGLSVYKTSYHWSF
ncbi:MAG: adenylate/guanylate cyclase domain-containing protein [Bacteroidaceae bacterium]|nr:adenylate/guanylate cyclase domain-containing protein [Bacteroidaceae bacterium]